MSSSTTKKFSHRSPRFVFAEGAVLFGFWLVMSGKLELFHIITGLLAVSFVVWLDRRLGPLSKDEDSISLHAHFLKLPIYLPWLAWQMILSSLHVGKVILVPRHQIHPLMLKFNSKMPSNAARVILGNSITLTPGTLTLEIQGDTFWVHALDETSAEGLLAGDMQKRVGRLFSAEPEKGAEGVEQITDIQELPW
ncbi:MAG: Na+/H+ antiporter subunit E [Opitutales bacterium]|nr:Na+/H+ antiporter subunit E [Opitutales bacterium]MCH8539294.1 Na+/H+ antiporter subunit E [Opitutales bacterium]